MPSLLDQKYNVLGLDRVLSIIEILNKKRMDLPSMKFQPFCTI